MKLDMDNSTIPEKPSYVATAVNVLYFSFALGLLRVLLDWWCGGSSAKQGEWAILLILGPVFLWTYYMTGKGRYWARDFVLILTLATVPLSMPLMIETLGHDSLSMPLRIGLVFLDVAGLFLGLAALIFLFQPDSVDSFKAIKQPFCAIPGIKPPKDDRISYAVDATEARRPENAVSFSSAIENIIVTLREITRNSFLSLLDTDQRIFSYVWRAWLVAFIPSWVLGAIAESSLALLGHKDPHHGFSSLLEFLIYAVLIAPWVETVIMWPVLAILKLILRKTMWVALVSGAIFGGLHVLGGPFLTQGVATTWAFLILSLCFLEWGKKSKGRAIAVTALVHTCTNGLSFMIVLVAVLLGGENPIVKKDSPSSPSQQQQVSAKTGAGAGESSSRSSVPPAQIKKKTELSAEEKRQGYERTFTGYGRQEFELAHEELYPDWKKNIDPNGTWEEFLLVYKGFVRWWEKRGCPAEPGFKLWKDYWATRSPA